MFVNRHYDKNVNFRISNFENQSTINYLEYQITVPISNTLESIFTIFIFNKYCCADVSFISVFFVADDVGLCGGSQDSVDGKSAVFDVNSDVTDNFICVLGRNVR